MGTEVVVSEISDDSALYHLPPAFKREWDGDEVGWWKRQMARLFKKKSLEQINDVEGMAEACGVKKVYTKRKTRRVRRV